MTLQSLTLSSFARGTVTSAVLLRLPGSKLVQVRFQSPVPRSPRLNASFSLFYFLLIIVFLHGRPAVNVCLDRARMHLTINITRPDTWQPSDTTPSPSQGMIAFHRDHTALLRQQMAPIRGCRTPTVTRVLHQGEEVPKEMSLQWLVNEMLSKNALHLGNEASRDPCGDESTEGQSSSSTLTLHVECGRSGEHQC